MYVFVIGSCGKIVHKKFVLVQYSLLNGFFGGEAFEIICLHS